MNGLRVPLDVSRKEGGQHGASELACFRDSVVVRTLLIIVVGESRFSLGKNVLAIGIHADSQKSHQLSPKGVLTSTELSLCFLPYQHSSDP